MKKLVALVLALALCLSLCTVTAFADTTVLGILKQANVPTSTGKDEHDRYIVPENAWVNETSGSKLFIIDELKFGIALQNQDEFYADMFVNNNTVSFGYVSFEFEMAENELVSITATMPNTISGLEELLGKYTAPTGDDDGHDWDYETLAKGVAIAAGITAATVGTIHTVKAIKNYKAEKAAAAEAAKLAEMPMVKMGDSGDAVKTLQTKLNELGYNCGEADGVFGQNTLNAVIAFQTAKGLIADGVVGRLTWAALL